MSGSLNSILFLDDEESILNALRRSLRKEGYKLFFALTPDDALTVLKQEKIEVVFSDHLMPEMTGLEFIKLVKEMYPDTKRCILTGQADLELAVKAINEGHVHRFLMKPWNDLELKVTLSQLFHQIELERENKTLNAVVAKQKSRIQELEKQHPGISSVQRDDSGAIVIDDVDLDGS